MEKERIKNKYSIQYTIEYEDSVKIEDFTASLNALSFEYKKFIIEKYGTDAPFDAQLCIEKIKEGSISTTLVEYTTFAMPFLGEVNTVVEFGKFLLEAYDYLLDKGEKPDKDLDLADFNQLEKISKTGAYSGNKTEINIKGDNNEIIIGGSYDYAENRHIVKRIKEEKKMLGVEDKEIYTKMPLIITNIKSDLNKKGNKGIIAEISSLERNIVWENDDLQEKMLKSDFNPTKFIFIVDVEMKKVNEEIKLYNIIYLHEYFEQ